MNNKNKDKISIYNIIAIKNQDAENDGKNEWRKKIEIAQRIGK